MEEKRLFELGPDRERKAVKVALFLSSFSPGWSPLAEMWGSLGIPNLSWFALEINTRWLIGKEPEAEVPGDIDIIAGPLTYRVPDVELRKLIAGDPHLSIACGGSPSLLLSLLAEKGLLEWPPCLDYLIGIEARACVWRQPGVPKKFYERISNYREKASGVVSLGFDRTLLLHLITIEPNPRPQQHVWISSLRETEAALSQFGLNIFSVDGDHFGEVAIPLGSIDQKPELEAGSAYPRVYRRPQTVKLNSRQRDLRNRIELKLRNKFLELSPPTEFPIFLTSRNGRPDRLSSVV